MTDEEIEKEYVNLTKALKSHQRYQNYWNIEETILRLDALSVLKAVRIGFWDEDRSNAFSEIQEKLK